MKATWLRWFGRIAAGVLAVAVILGARAWVGSKQELDAGRALEAQGDVDLAIVHYRRAARWYAPGNPHVVSALEALARIGTKAEADRDAERALAAWRGVRAAIYSTRSFFTPHAERLATANGHIADLMSRHQLPPMDQGRATAAVRADHLALLERTQRPHVGFALLALLGFAAWTGSAYGFFAHGLDEEDRVIRVRAVRFGLGFLLGFAAFAVGLLFA